MKKLTIILIFICSISFGQSVITNNAGTSAISSNDGSKLVVSAPSVIPEVPETISDLFAWYDSSVLTAGFLSSWDDRSNNNYNLLQASGTAQPEKTSNGVEFDGINDFMKSAAFTRLSPPFTVIFLATKTSSNAAGFVCDGEASSSGAAIFYNLASFPDLGISNYSNVLGYNLPSGLFTDEVLTFVVEADNSVTVYRNNSSQATGTLSNLYFDSFNIGSYQSGTNFLEGNFKEIITYDRDLTTEEMTILYDYLIAKY